MVCYTRRKQKIGEKRRGRACKGRPGICKSTWEPVIPSLPCLTPQNLLAQWGTAERYSWCTSDLWLTELLSQGQLFPCFAQQRRTFRLPPCYPSNSATPTHSKAIIPCTDTPWEAGPSGHLHAEANMTQTLTISGISSFAVVYIAAEKTSKWALQQQRNSKDCLQQSEEREQPGMLCQWQTEPWGHQGPFLTTLPEVVPRWDSVGRVLVVQAPEGIPGHAVGSSSVEVAVPVDLQPHDPTLQSREEETPSDPRVWQSSTGLPGRPKPTSQSFFPIATGGPSTYPHPRTITCSVELILLPTARAALHFAVNPCPVVHATRWREAYPTQMNPKKGFCQVPPQPFPGSSALQLQLFSPDER